MATWTENERNLVRQFDRALTVRDAGDLAQALQLLEELVAQLTQSDARLLLHSHLQMAQLLEKLGRVTDAELHARFAIKVGPRAELPSLCLFHLLSPLGRITDALTEAVRFLAQRESLGYRELFISNAYTTLLPSQQRRLAKQARQLLDNHREAQRARPVPIVLDTVRIRAAAPGSLRPRSLASIFSIDGAALRVSFSDGELAELPLTLVDHHDI